MATVTFGSSSPFGALTGWNCTGSTVTTDAERANALDNIGNEVVSVFYDGKTEVQASYVASSASAPTIPAEIGAVVNGYILTSIQVSTSRDGFATMTLTGHNHLTHAHSGTEKKVAHSLTLGAGFGAKDFLGGTAGSDAAVRSGTVTIECQHADETDSDGNHLVGENYTPMITAETEWTGEPSATATTGWDVTSVDVPTENTGFKSTKVSGTKSLAFS